jgi:hypothetical protein
LVHGRLESFKIPWGLGPAGVVVGVLRLFRVIAVHFGLARDSVGESGPAMGADDDIIAIPHGPFQETLTMD